MSSRRLTPAQLVGLCAVLLVAAGCGNSSATWPGLIQRTASPSGTASATGTAFASGTDKAVAVATAGRTAAPQATGARATAAPVTIGKITADFSYFVETTMIGQATFDEAASYAGNEFDDAQPHLTAGDADYGWVSIADDRTNGILPIPWR